jgi:hypothetical protein
MRFYNLRLSPNETVSTAYGTAIQLQPNNLSPGDRQFTGILSTVTLRMSGMDSEEIAITARLTEDSDGDLCTMPDTSCGLSRGLTSTDKTTSVFKFEAQFSDEYPLNLFVKTGIAEATLDEVILSYRMDR